ncbi:MAG: TolC family protein [Lachnospiraceae bacterium]|nr:TolC family protein [Lachnospiraceae bacterium]
MGKQRNRERRVCRAAAAVLAISMLFPAAAWAAPKGPGYEASPEELKKQQEAERLAAEAGFDPALLSGRPEDMEEMTWLKLQDSVLEYEELENRVMHFNPTILQIQDAINDSYDSIEDSITDYQEAANDFERLYEDAVDQGDIMSAYMYQMNKTIVRKMSSSYLKAEKKREATIERNTRQARKGFTSGCQQLMLAYNKMQVNKATLEKQVELYGAMAAMSGTQTGIGLATQTDLLSANAKMHSAQVSLASLNTQMESVKSSLLMMLGWDFNSDIQIGAIPRADVSQIDAIDFAADKAKAPGYNYSVLDIRNARPADADGDGKYENKDYAARERSVDQAKQQLSITLDNVYQTLFEKRAALQAAETAFQAAQIKWDGANRKRQMGMLGTAEYLGEEIAYDAAKAARDSADLDMTQAMLNYYWAVNGLGELAQ